MVSKRPATKHANEQANGIRPVSARPAPTPIMFASTMPRLNARPGKVFANFAVMVDFDRSASRVTIRSSLAPSSRSASPNAARLALAGITSSRGRRARPRWRASPRQFSRTLRGLRRLTVPLRVVLHEGHALALHGVGHDEGRGAAGRLRLVEGLRDLGDVVAVDLHHGPAERLPLGDDRLEVQDLLHEVVELDLVVVEDDHEIVERMVGLTELRCRHRGFPHLPLLDLAVAEDAVDAGRGAGELEPER